MKAVISAMLPYVERNRLSSCDKSGISWQSRVGLNATNFFLAEVVGVVLPFLNDFLKESGWRYQTIGIATAIFGLAVFLMQTPAGMIVDHALRRRTLLAVASLAVGFPMA